jgi:hypothetical protein
MMDHQFKPPPNEKEYRLVIKKTFKLDWEYFIINLFRRITGRKKNDENK